MSQIERKATELRPSSKVGRRLALCPPRPLDSPVPRLALRALRALASSAHVDLDAALRCAAALPRVCASLFALGAHDVDVRNTAERTAGP